MQILRLPPNTDRYPEHDHSASGQEEVFTVLDGAVTLRAGDEEYRLEPGAFARVGPGENRKLLTGDEGDGACARRIAGRPFEPVTYTNEGEPDPLDG